jgi:HPt (histidine-containing phosphotransfer) domain-containing protein
MSEWQTLPILNFNTLEKQTESLGFVFFSILQGYSEGLDDRLAIIEDALRQSDIKALEQAAHRLSGAAMTFGNEQVACLAGEVLQYTRAGKLPPPALLEALRQATAKAEHTMLQYLADSDRL